jgi:phosphoribosylformylglycinamidine synthase subunit PurQ / glutaminase
MRIAIFSFPSSDYASAIKLAIEQAGMVAVPFSKEKLLEHDGYIILTELTSTKDGSIIDMLKQQNKLGKPILGIHAGAQVLVEAGLVPGVEDDQVGLFFEDNRNPNLYVNIRLSNHYQYNAFTRLLKPEKVLKVSAAEKCFKVPPALLLEIQENGMDVFHYCDEQGYAVNAIAAISNKAGNVLALMPKLQLTLEADAIFLSMREYIVKGYKQRVSNGSGRFIIIRVRLRKNV